MKRVPLPAFADNYIWLLHDGPHALAVDPGESTVVLAWLREHPEVRLDTILVTHHHADHTGGLADLVATTGARVLGPALEKLPVPAEGVQEGYTFDWHGVSFQVLDVPGHTSGHVAYWTAAGAPSPTLFCGDTLFSGGCGRLFEGTPEQMLASLDRLAALPGDTMVCCAHEYTLSNLRFALAVEPDNAELQRYQLECAALRERQQPTLPATLSRETQINPFLRSRNARVRQAVQARTPDAGDDVSVFAALRQWKNEFR